MLTGTDIKIDKSLDKGAKCGALQIDLSKTFDCLVHDLFKAKLHAYGFEPWAIGVQSWPVWLNGWVFVFELSGFGFESSCSH